MESSTKGRPPVGDLAKRQQLQVYLRDDQAAALRALAELEGRSLSGMVGWILEQYLQRTDAELRARQLELARTAVEALGPVVVSEDAEQSDADENGRGRATDAASWKSRVSARRGRQ